MLKYFFEDARQKDLHAQGHPVIKKDWSFIFKGLKIMDAGEKYTAQMGQYPVIYLTFKDTKGSDFEASYKQMVWELASEYSRHDFILEALEAEKKKIYSEIIRQEADRRSYEKAILFLAECLETYYGRRAVILIDEYDVPLENAFSRGFYDEMAGFARALFESGLKDNPSLEFAVITGCLRVSKDRQYATELNDEGYEMISCYGMAFFEKDCVVRCRAWTAQTDPRKQVLRSM